MVVCAWDGRSFISTGVSSCACAVSPTNRPALMVNAVTDLPIFIVSFLWLIPQKVQFADESWFACREAIVQRYAGGMITAHAVHAASGRSGRGTQIDCFHWRAVRRGTKNRAGN